jgi:hypothetical protein
MRLKRTPAPAAWERAMTDAAILRVAFQVRLRVRKRNTTLVAIPSTHPMTAAARITHTTDARDVPKTQSSSTDCVFLAIKMIRITSSSTNNTAHVYKRACLL